MIAACHKIVTQKNHFREIRGQYTIRYKEYIYEKVKELTVEQVAKNEKLTPRRVDNIFQRIAKRQKKTGDFQKV